MYDKKEFEKPNKGVFSHGKNYGANEFLLLLIPSLSFWFIIQTRENIKTNRHPYKYRPPIVHIQPRKKF
jgi:hypothetical protein